MNPAYPGILAVALYVFGTYSQFRHLKARTAAQTGQVLLVAGIALCLHGVSVAMLMMSPTGLDLSLFTVSSLVAFALTLFVTLASLAQPLHNLFILVFPIAGVAVAGSLMLGGRATPIGDLSAGFLIHIVTSIFAYTVLTTAACQSLLLSAQERQIRRRQSYGLLRILPPLETMEAMLFQLLWAGLALLTLAIVSGFAFLDDLFAQHVVHHTALAMVSWVIYAFLLAGRYALGWRGTTATRWTLTAFAFLVLAYWGSKFVLEFLVGGS